MSTFVAIQDSDLDFDYGTFDSAGFTKKTLANPQALAAVIDHTLLKPDATREQVEALCDEAVRYRFACVHGESGLGIHRRRPALPAPAFPSASSSAFRSARRSFPRCARKPLRSSAWARASSTW